MLLTCTVLCALFGYQDLVFLRECKILFRLVSVFLRVTETIRSGRQIFPEYSCTKSSTLPETSYTDTFTERRPASQPPTRQYKTSESGCQDKIENRHIKLFEHPESSFELASITKHLENFLSIFTVPVTTSEITLPKLYNNLFRFTT